MYRYDARGNKVAEGDSTATGLLREVTRSGKAVWKREYDAAGREGRLITYNTNGAEIEYKYSYYDPTGRLLYQRTTTPTPGEVRKSDLFFELHHAGNVQKLYASSYQSDGNTIPATGWQEYDYTYDERGSYLESRIDGRWNSGSGVKSSTYDVNGNLLTVTDTVERTQQQYVVTPQGVVLSKTLYKDNNFQEADHFLQADRKMVGSYTVKADGNLDTKFSYNYSPVTEHYPAATPGSYTVSNESESLPSIALAVFGDSNLWYLIVDANGLTGTEQLKPGQLLKIPNTVANVRNATDTFRPLNPNDYLDGTLPQLSIPKPKGVDQCKKAVVIIVAVVVAIIVAAYTKNVALAGKAYAGVVAGMLGAA